MNIVKTMTGMDLIIHTMVESTEKPHIIFTEVLSRGKINYKTKSTKV